MLDNKIKNFILKRMKNIKKELIWKKLFLLYNIYYKIKFILKNL